MQKVEKLNLSIRRQVPWLNKIVVISLEMNEGKYKMF